MKFENINVVTTFAAIKTFVRTLNRITRHICRFATPSSHTAEAAEASSSSQPDAAAYGQLVAQAAAIWTLHYCRAGVRACSIYNK
jgi:hypothetical protein